MDNKSKKVSEVVKSLHGYTFDDCLDILEMAHRIISRLQDNSKLDVSDNVFKQKKD